MGRDYGEKNGKSIRDRDYGGLRDKRAAPPSRSYRFLVPLHLGYAEHPQNVVPAFAPRFAVRATIILPHLGQLGESELMKNCVVSRFGMVGSMYGCGS